MSLYEWYTNCDATRRDIVTRVADLPICDTAWVAPEVGMRNRPKPKYGAIHTDWWACVRMICYLKAVSHTVVMAVGMGC